LDSESVVQALRRLLVFGIDQSGAYRELYEAIAAALGADVETKLAASLRRWATSNEPGTFILTGNAGTGKTAAAQAYCVAVGAELPETDELVALPGGQVVAKDVSGMDDRESRADAFRETLGSRLASQSLLCANEGILRDAAEDLGEDYPDLRGLLDAALRFGAAAEDSVTIVNVNRQRLTAPALWEQLLDYITRPELWSGCVGCPASMETENVDVGTVGCPIRSNAEALRQADVRATLRLLVQTASGDAVPTIRELLALLAWAVVGDANQASDTPTGLTCEVVRDSTRDRGASAFTASTAYYNLLFGEGLPSETRERSPLLSAMERLGVGLVADLEVDEWLRDTGSSNGDIQRLAGRPSAGTEERSFVAGSKGPLDRLRTTAGEMTYHRLGEIVSISEDPELVRAGTKALVASDLPAQRMWRRRVIFEGSPALGGAGSAVSRLTALTFAPVLVALAARIARGEDTFAEIRNIVRGLNFLVAGYCDAAEGLIVPEPASLFARNPGSFRNARPAFVHTTIDNNRVSLELPDTGVVATFVDVDHVEVRLVVDADATLGLPITPRLFQAIREAEGFQGPVGQGAAEMTDLRGFYGRLAAGIEREQGLHVADPSKSAIVRVQLPHFPSHV